MKQWIGWIEDAYYELESPTVKAIAERVVANMEGNDKPLDHPLLLARIEGVTTLWWALCVFQTKVAT